MDVRKAEEGEVDRLAGIWYDGWQDAHAAILPDILKRLRTRENLAEMLREALPDVRVAGAPGDALGFCIIKDDEIYQLYVSAQARGTGVAAALISDGEDRLSAKGVTTAWLACAIGNERAARFYEKQGWVRAGTVTIQAETPSGKFPLEVWRYEKQL